MLVLTILLLTLDFQRLELPDDAMANSFALSPLENESLTGCVTNPQSGGNRSPLIIDRSEPPELATENHVPWTPVFCKEGDGGNLQSMVVVLPGGNPQPTINVPASDPPQELPVSTTPEPSTVAILGITAAVLIAMLFGRRYGRKPSRHI